MNAKLTLTIESDVVDMAKKYAAVNGRSLSDLVENYLKSLSERKQMDRVSYSPKVSKLKGIMDLPDDFDYKKFMEKELSKKHLDK